MSSHKQPVRTACFAVLAGMVFGCGGPAGGMGQGSQWGVQQQRPGDQQLAPMPHAGQDQGVMAAGEDREKAIIDHLKLTPDQLSKVQVLVQRLRGEREEAIGQRAAVLGRLLASKDIDMQNLVAHLRQDREAIKQRLQEMVAVIAGIRDILTEEQRAKLIQLRLADDEAEPQAFAKELQLTDEQKQALEALRPKAADTSLREAIRAFLMSGDRPLLHKAIAASIEALPSADVIAKGLASLSPEQRANLVKLVAEHASAEAPVKEAAAQ